MGRVQERSPGDLRPHEAAKNQHTLTPSNTFEFMIQAFDSLGNDLLLRLLWQIFTFYEAPFLSTPKNLGDIRRK